MRDIGKNIRSLRQSKNMTQDELAEKLFVTRQTVSNYETGKSRPDVDMLVKISEILGTDIHQVIYGPEPVKLTKDVKRLIIGAAITLVLLIALEILSPIVKEYQRQTFFAGYSYLLHGVIRPLAWLTGGWTLALLLGMALKRKPLDHSWVKYARRVVIALVCAWIGIVTVFAIVMTVDGYLYRNYIRGYWEETPYIANGVTQTSKGWRNLPLPTPQWFNTIAATLAIWGVQYPLILPLSGAALWLLGFPKGKEKQG